MAFNETISKLGVLLSEAIVDLGKVHKGNKSAAQRVRVGTIDIEKIAKKFRKESVAAEKKSLAKKRLVLRRKRPKNALRRSRRKSSL